jgi:hypothetical protein
LGFFWGWDVIDGLSIAISRCCGAGPFLCGYCLGWLAQTPTLKTDKLVVFPWGNAVFRSIDVVMFSNKNTCLEDFIQSLI